MTWRATRARHFAQQPDPHFKPFSTRRDFGGAGMRASASLALLKTHDGMIRLVERVTRCEIILPVV
ncbi:MAG: hypothetical protein EOS58_27465 [Mesorhizobium sp.]|nr:MAG: hypothetical protein EOS58_27465 [Mesorhizobium sp.]